MNYWTALKQAVEERGLTPTELNDEYQYMTFSGLWMVGSFEEEGEGEPYYLSEAITLDEGGEWTDPETYTTSTEALEALVSQISEFRDGLNAILGVRSGDEEVADIATWFRGIANQSGSPIVFNGLAETIEKREFRS